MFHQEKGRALWADLLYVELGIDTDRNALFLMKV